MNKWVVLLLLLTSKVFAKFDTFHSIKDQSIRDISFDVKSESLGNLMHKKFMLAKRVDFVARFYWSDTQGLDAEILTKYTNVEEKLLNEFLKILKDQINNLIFKDFYSQLKTYNQKQDSNKATVYFDPTGIKKFHEIMLTEENDKMFVKLIGPGEQVDMDYTFERFQWSKRKLVLTNTKRIEISALQNTEITTQLTYQQLGKLWFIHTMNIDINQKLKMTTKQGHESKRHIKDSYLFENMKINQNAALNWFAKKN